MFIYLGLIKGFLYSSLRAIGPKYMLHRYMDPQGSRETQSEVGHPQYLKHHG